jgi:nucleoside diphosphate kinase
VALLSGQHRSVGAHSIGAHARAQPATRMRACKRREQIERRRHRLFSIAAVDRRRLSHALAPALRSLLHQKTTVQSTKQNKAKMATERSYIMIKPDGVQRGLVGEVIKRFESRGFKLVALKLIQVEKAHAEKHYSDLSSKPFFGGLVDYICSGPVVAMVWEGKGVVAVGRMMIGATNPQVREREKTFCFFGGGRACRRRFLPFSFPRRSRPLYLLPPSKTLTPSLLPPPNKTQQHNNTQNTQNTQQQNLKKASAPGTIRGDFCIEVGRNVIHGSDTVDNANKEIGLWFPEGVADWTPAANPWIYE